MGTFIGKLLDELLGFVKKNYKRPGLWISVLLIIFCFYLLFPYIDSNFLYFSRMDKRIELLEKTMSLDQEEIKANPVYQKEYESILREMEHHEDSTINSVMNKLYTYFDNLKAAGKEQGNKVIKFFAGAFWCILVTVWVPFMNTFHKRSDRILAFIMMIGITLIVGYLCMLIPIIINPWVNYIGIPILQLVLVIILLCKPSKK